MHPSHGDGHTKHLQCARGLPMQRCGASAVPAAGHLASGFVHVRRHGKCGMHAHTEAAATDSQQMPDARLVRQAQPCPCDAGEHRRQAMTHASQQGSTLPLLLAATPLFARNTHMKALCRRMHGTLPSCRPASGGPVHGVGRAPPSRHRPPRRTFCLLQHLAVLAWLHDEAPVELLEVHKRLAAPMSTLVVRQAVWRPQPG